MIYLFALLFFATVFGELCEYRRNIQPHDTALVRDFSYSLPIGAVYEDLTTISLDTSDLGFTFAISSCISVGDGTCPNAPSCDEERTEWSITDTLQPIDPDEFYRKFQLVTCTVTTNASFAQIVFFHDTGRFTCDIEGSLLTADDECVGTLTEVCGPIASGNGRSGDSTSPAASFSVADFL